MRLGVDIGGTFTDFVWLDDAGRLHLHKRLSTPGDPARSVVEGAAELGVLADPAAQVVHGSTIATTVINAYVTPVVDRYLARLEAQLAPRSLRVMQSNGGSLTAASARRQAARTALRAGNRLPGPAILFQLDATTVIPPGWQGQVDPFGHILLERLGRGL